MSFYGSGYGSASFGLGMNCDALLREILKEAGGVLLEDSSPAAVDMAAIAKRDGVVTRAQGAEYFGVSAKTIQRMDAKGILKRCPGLPGIVRYRARDVLRLASAPGKER